MTKKFEKKMRKGQYNYTLGIYKDNTCINNQQTTILSSYSHVHM